MSKIYKGLRYLLNCILLLLLTTQAFTQTTLPPVYEIKADTPVRFLPDVYWQMLVDSNGKWSIKDVTSPPLNDRFHTNNTKQTGVGYSGINHYWQRLRLKNSTGKEQKLIFVNRPWVDHFELYVIRNTGEAEQLVSGPWIPFEERNGFKRRNAVPVVISSGEEVVFYKKLFLKKNENLNELIIGFSFYEPFIEQAYINTPWRGDDVRNWFIAGFLIFGFFLNFFFFWIVREKVYFYLALLLLCEGLWYTTLNSGITFKNFPDFRSLFELIVTHILVFFSATQFVRHFLKTPKYYPRWDKLIITLLIIMILSHLSFRVFHDTITYTIRGIPYLITALFFAALMFALLISFLFFRKEKNRLTTLGVIAALPALVLWSIGYLANRIYGFREIRYSLTPSSFIQEYFNLEFVIEMFCVAWFAILFTWILLQRYALLRKQLTQQALEREKEKTELINKQKELLEREVEKRTAELKQSLEELKTTQKQLIESEKMASLGELTAGIAHEIQNPLNFVNNFSEVSAELADELKREVTEGDKEESIAIAEDIKQNMQKIVHHGKRADAIVKGMLLHSRASAGKKELTDINALADEYLRLSYHGLRAKEKTFNATIQSDFDETLMPVSIVPQDIGRVLLNLITNAFYSVTEKKKLLNEEYEPTVSVTTKKLKDNVQISVKDNGTGIPQKAVDKIFQPFFSTKPTGEGTGLGLSISYDIIKAHGGELKVETKESEGSEFVISLPVV